jgi:hypothetical protein
VVQFDVRTEARRSLGIALVNIANFALPFLNYMIAKSALGQACALVMASSPPMLGGCRVRPQLRYKPIMGLLGFGTLLTVISWAAAWSSFGWAAQYAFFPLWLGYIFFVNGLSQVVFGTSLQTAMGRSFIWLFMFSMPMWWFFELMNSIVHNWHYVFACPITPLHYDIQASIDFSTVIPAVLSTAFFLCLVMTEHQAWFDKRPFPAQGASTIEFVAGCTCFALLMLFPNEGFPLVWIAPLLVLDAFARVMRVPNAISVLAARGNYLPIAAVAAATLITGFFWECWNIYSSPKWIYTIPYVGFWKVFEMPILGYLGYPFFGWFIFSYTATCLWLMGKRDLFRDFFARA